MDALSIAQALQYSKLQMAAEAFLVTGPTDGLKDDLVKALTDGNLHASRFPSAAEATSFLNDWQVVTQKSNTNTGFSGTLFQRIKDDPITGEKAGAYVISMRSTEFIDDAVRDSESTNKDIADFGWGFGQIDDMQKWYASLNLPAGANLSVTGYSLGGHLATAFNLLYPGAATKVVTFNGAGVGSVGGLPTLSGQQLLLTTMMSDFHDLRSNARTLMSTPVGQALYDAAKAQLDAERATNTLTSAMLSTWIDGLRTTDATVAEAADRGQLTAALDRVRLMVLENERIVNFHPEAGSSTTPVIADQSKTDAESLDYQLAVLSTAKTYSASSLGLLSGATNIFFGKTYPDGGPLSNQYDLVGTEMDGATTASMVAHSQYHYGQDQGLFIEDQPGLRGTALGDAVGQSFAYAGVKLLVNNYTQNDFGDTHSLVLIVDSLTVQNVLQQLDKNVTQDTLNAIFKQSSYLKASFSTGTPGQAEGDVLENVVNALGDMLKGGAGNNTVGRLKGHPLGNTWHETNSANIPGYTSRTDLYNTLNTLIASDAFKALVTVGASGAVTLKATLPSAATAKTDFGAFVSLQTLSPFVLTGSGAENALKTTWDTTYSDWLADKALTAAQREAGQARYSERWYEDRAKFLVEVGARAQTNTLSARDAAIGPGKTWEFSDSLLPASLQAFGAPPFKTDPHGPPPPYQRTGQACHHGRRLQRLAA